MSISSSPRYFFFLRREVGARIYLIFLLSVFSTVSESFGIALVFPLVGLFFNTTNTESSTAGQDLFSSLFVKLFDIFGLEYSLYPLMFLMMSLFATKAVMLFFSNGYLVYLTAQLSMEAKKKLFLKYMNMDYVYYASKNTGYFYNVVNDQVGAMVGAFKSYVSLVAVSLSATTYFVMSMLASYRFTLIAALAGLGLLLFYLRLNLFVRGLSRKNAEENGRLASLLIQSLQSYKYLASTGIDAVIKLKFMRSLDKLNEYRWKDGLASVFTSVTQEPIIITVLVFAIFVNLEILSGSVEGVFLSILFLYRLMGSLLNVQTIWQSIMKFSGGVDIVRSELHQQDRNQSVDGKIELTRFPSLIRFSNVHFSYTGRNFVLKGINLSIVNNSVIGIVGLSGAGKSTIADLLTMVLRPSAGEILFDDTQSTAIQVSSWRKYVGYVSQDPPLFDATILDNITLWDSESEGELILSKAARAADLANISNFINTLPNGYNTSVGDRGLCLSGGQRQRLALARELYRDPKILILDEATSALDSESEAAIKTTIEQLRGNTTIIIIAHRLTTIRNVDRIYVLENGVVLEEGSYDELNAIDGSLLSRLVRLQAS